MSCRFCLPVSGSMNRITTTTTRIRMSVLTYAIFCSIDLAGMAKNKFIKGVLVA
jgi:hypothetical protein